VTSLVHSPPLYFSPLSYNFGQNLFSKCKFEIVPVNCLVLREERIPILLQLLKLLATDKILDLFKRELHLQNHHKETSRNFPHQMEVSNGKEKLLALTVGVLSAPH